MAVKFIIFSVVVGAFLVVIDNVVYRPFSFVNIIYLDDGHDWPPHQYREVGVQLDIPLSPQMERNALRLVTAFDRGEGDKIALTRATRHLIAKSSGSQVRMLEDVLDKGTDYLNICSEASKIAAVLAQALGYGSRVVWMDGHTVTEIHDGTKWYMIDTHGNVLFRDIDGTPLSAVEIRDNPNATPEKIVVETTPELPEYFDGEQIVDDMQDIFYDQWLYVVFDAEHLFDFHKTSSSIAHIIKSAFGLGAPLAIQFINDEDPLVGNVGVNFIERFTARHS